MILEKLQDTHRAPSYHGNTFITDLMQLNNSAIVGAADVLEPIWLCVRWIFITKYADIIDQVVLCAHDFSNITMLQEEISNWYEFRL